MTKLSMHSTTIFFVSLFLGSFSFGQTDPIVTWLDYPFKKNESPRLNGPRGCEKIEFVGEGSKQILISWKSAFVLYDIETQQYREMRFRTVSEAKRNPNPLFHDSNDSNLLSRTFLQNQVSVNQRTWNLEWVRPEFMNGRYLFRVGTSFALDYSLVLELDADFTTFKLVKLLPKVGGTINNYSGDWLYFHYQRKERKSKLVSVDVKEKEIAFDFVENNPFNNQHSPIESKRDFDDAKYHLFQRDPLRFVSLFDDEISIFSKQLKRYRYPRDFHPYSHGSPIFLPGNRIVVGGSQLQAGRRIAAAMVFDCDTGKSSVFYDRAHKQFADIIKCSQDGKMIVAGYSTGFSIFEDQNGVYKKVGSTRSQLSARIGSVGVHSWDLSKDGKSLAFIEKAKSGRLGLVSIDKCRFDLTDHETAFNLEKRLKSEKIPFKYQSIDGSPTLLAVLPFRADATDASGRWLSGYNIQNDKSKRVLVDMLNNSQYAGIEGGFSLDGKRFCYFDDERFRIWNLTGDMPRVVSEGSWNHRVDEDKFIDFDCKTSTLKSSRSEFSFTTDGLKNQVSIESLPGRIDDVAIRDKGSTRIVLFNDEAWFYQRQGKQFTGQKKQKISNAQINQELELSPKGSFIFGEKFQGPVSVWRLKNGEYVKPFEISIEQSPSSYQFTASPNENWFLYVGRSYAVEGTRVVALNRDFEKALDLVIPYFEHVSSSRKNEFGMITNDGFVFIPSELGTFVYSASSGKKK